MASVNKVILVGFLGKDPEIRFTTDNSLQIASLTVATTRVSKNQVGERMEETEWHRIVIFGRQAEFVQKYLRKGSQVYVEGRLRTRKWEKDGIVRYTTEIIGENILSLERRQDSSNYNSTTTDGGFEQNSFNQRNSSPSENRGYPATSQASSFAPTSTAAPSAPDLDAMDEDIPF